MTRRRLTIVATVAVICLMLGFCVLQQRVVIPQRPFDSQAWRRWPPKHWALATERQRMIRDLVVKVLPGRTRDQIEGLLGRSVTFKEMRRYGDNSPLADDGHYVRNGEGHYFDEFNWDLIYETGLDLRTANWDEPDEEYLVIRLGRDGLFKSWYMISTVDWPKIVGAQGLESYSQN